MTANDIIDTRSGVFAVVANILGSCIYVLLLAILLVYATFVIRIFAPVIGNNTIIYDLRIVEEYVVLFIVLCCLLLNKTLIVKNAAPVFIVLSYFVLISLIDGRYDFIYSRFIFFSYIHYIAFINILRRLEKKAVFFIFVMFGLFVSSFLLYILFQHQWVIRTIFEGGRRAVLEETGMQLNANSISSLIVGILTILVVIKHNFHINREMAFLTCIYYVLVFISLLVTCSVSASLFYLFILCYDIYKTWRSRGVMFIIFVFIGLFSVFSMFGGLKVNSTLFRRLSGADTHERRIIDMGKSISIFRSNPLFGISQERLAGIEKSVDDNIDHNFFTKFLGSEGIVGSLVFVYFFHFFLWPRGRAFPGIYLLRFYCLFFLIFAPSIGLLAYAAAFISEFSRPRVALERLFLSSHRRRAMVPGFSYE